MATTVNVVCYKSKVLKNNESPLMIRVCKDRKRKYISIGLSINPIYWDFTKNAPKPQCPNKEALTTLITLKLHAYSEQIMEFKAMDRDYTASTLVEKVSKPSKLKTVGEVFLEQMQALRDAQRLSYMLTIQQTYNSLMEFNKHLNIYFVDIDVPWLKRYETWLRKHGLSGNTIKGRFVDIRTMYNIAVDENLVKVEHYPFRKFKISKLQQETAKRAITKEDVTRIMEYKTKNKLVQFAIDIFTFSYIMGGINFVDIASLTKENIMDNRLVYIRQKTKKLIQLPLQDKAIELIEKYHDDNNPHLFPILLAYHKTEQQRLNRVHKVIVNVNKRLKKIGKELELPITLTTYVARHSHATILKKAGVATSIISESLGHSSEKVTQIYLDSFGNEQMDDAMKNLL
ncbi:site-specific integrase [uncultured Bacteroides sp.]|uniref:site-specific integrase n=1 Tax=uncultured Bacteroides sp. TaxID=162156 RepID=UPI0025DE4575|nr:site-specific integrase [uncultured Bacteroides sp.]